MGIQELLPMDGVEQPQHTHCHMLHFLFESVFRLLPPPLDRVALHPGQPQAFRSYLGWAVQVVRFIRKPKKTIRKPLENQ